MSSLGSLVVSLSANTAQFTSDMGKAAHEAAKRMEDMKKGAEKAAKAIGAMFLAGTATAAVLVKQQIDAADATAKMAQKVGESTQAMSEWVHVAQMSGVEANAFAVSMSRLSDVVSDVARGAGAEAALAFNALGISVKDADGKLKNSSQIMTEVADKFAQYEDGANKTALAVQIFGQRGAELIPLLNSGADGIASMREEARLLGATIDAETGQAAERFGDNIARLNTVKQGLANTVMRQVLPMLEGMTSHMVEAGKEAGAFQTVADSVTVMLKGMVLVGANVAYVFKGIGNEIGGIAAQIAALSRGDFEAFSFIGEQMKADAEKARKEIDAFNEMIFSVGDKIESKAPETGAKIAAPLTVAAAKAQEEAKKMEAAARRAAEAVQREAERLRDQDAAGWVAYIEARQSEYEEYLNEQARMAKDAAENQKKVMLESTEFTRQAARNMQDAMSGGFFDIMEGRSVKMGQLFGQIVKKMIADMMAAKALTALFGDYGSTGKMGGIVGNIFGALAGKRANGGPVVGNNTYLVGERGPELFTPSTSGNIVPNHDLGSGGAMSLTFAPVYHIDSRSDRAMIQQDLVRSSRQTKAELVEELSRAGMLRR